MKQNSFMFRCIVGLICQTYVMSKENVDDIKALFHSENTTTVETSMLSIGNTSLLSDSAHYAEGGSNNQDKLKIAIQDGEKNYLNESKISNKPKEGLDVNQSTISDFLKEASNMLEEGKTSKIMARKGVSYEDDELNPRSSCLVVGNNNCYNITQYKNATFFCCEATSVLVVSNAVINCSLCNSNTTNNTLKPCKNICCTEKTYYEGDSSSVSSTKSAHNATQVPAHDNVSSIAVTTHNPILVANKNGTNKSNMSSVKHEDGSSPTPKPRKKPQVTKVPNDVENVDSSVKSEKEIVVPIVVSMLIIPMIGVLILFLYRKSREYWDKRHYKRMDFLIDGIYND